MISKIIGRDPNCQYVIFDPERRVSRSHAELIYKDNQYFIKDLGSANGTYVNGQKLETGKTFKVHTKDRITLSNSYSLNLTDVIPSDVDATLILNSKSLSNSSSKDVTIFFGSNNKTVLKENGKTIEFDRDKTTIGEIIDLDSSPFVTIGRSQDNKFIIDHTKISRNHCKIRMVTPQIIEFIDLGSTNGSYADGEKLVANKSYKFDTSVKLSLGATHAVDLKNIFPKIQLIQKNPLTNQRTSPLAAPGSPATLDELKQFTSLESIWQEYSERQNLASGVNTGYSIGGSLAGLAAAAFTGVTGGVGGLLLMTGGGLLGRYLGQQKSSTIRNDLTYENAFLETYACPRCKESFQKKPWITIRECFRCKIKFR